jgi:uncharacterized protein (DUF486 family)
MRHAARSGQMMSSLGRLFAMTAVLTIAFARLFSTFILRHKLFPIEQIALSLFLLRIFLIVISPVI